MNDFSDEIRFLERVKAQLQRADRLYRLIRKYGFTGFGEVEEALRIYRQQLDAEQATAQLKPVEAS